MPWWQLRSTIMTKVKTLLVRKDCIACYYNTEPIQIIVYRLILDKYIHNLYHIFKRIWYSWAKWNPFLYYINIFSQVKPWKCAPNRLSYYCGTFILIYFVNKLLELTKSVWKLAITVIPRNMKTIAYKYNCLIHDFMVVNNMIIITLIFIFVIFYFVINSFEIAKFVIKN